MFNAGSSFANATTTKWIGYANFNVIAVNPTKEEYEKLFYKQLDYWKGYISKDNNGVETVRVVFVLQNSDPQATMPLVNATFWLRRRARKNKDQTKTQVIDKYGNTAWVTDAEFQAQAVPIATSGKPLGIIPPYRPCCDGEDKIIEFLKALWYAKSPFKWNEATSTREKIEGDLSTYEFGLDNIKDYWNGDFSELKQAINDQSIADHTINAMLYLRKGEWNGNEVFRQEVFHKVVPGYADFDRIQKEYVREQQAGMHATDRFAFQAAFIFTPDVQQPTQVFQSNHIPTVTAAPVAGTTYPNIPVQASEDELPF